MKVLVTASVVWGRLSLGKGVHDLPSPVARDLMKAGLAREIQIIDTSIRNVDNKNIGGGGVKRSKRNRSKKPVQG